MRNGEIPFKIWLSWNKLISLFCYRMRTTPHVNSKKGNLVRKKNLEFETRNSKKSTLAKQGKEKTGLEQYTAPDKIPLLIQKITKINPFPQKNVCNFSHTRHRINLALSRFTNSYFASNNRKSFKDLQIIQNTQTTEFIGNNLLELPHSVVHYTSGDDVAHS